MNTDISVIICTHNPRQEYLAEVLSALRGQSQPMTGWELLLIDNASDSPLDGRIDLSWHPNAGIIREEKLGLTPARLRGIQEAKAELLVFVDDDNLLESKYLQVVAEIDKKWPQLGAWSGQILPRFEREPEPWAAPYLHRLALRSFDSDQWFKIAEVTRVLNLLPYGAGMCTRCKVATEYARQLATSSNRQLLGRRGRHLDSAEDLDLAMTAIDLGYGWALFRDLIVTHLIPAVRLTEEYLLRLTESQMYSLVMLLASRGEKIEAPPLTWRMRFGEFRQSRRMGPYERKFGQAYRAGQERAYRDLGLRGKS